MLYLYMFLGIVLISIITRWHFTKQSKKALIEKLKGDYGMKANREFDIEDIQYFMKAHPETTDIDQITWNDLDMDRIYSRINNCNSFIGEQYLYRELHVISKTLDELNSRNELIEYFESNPEKRLEVQLLLAKIGREKMNYFLPEFLSGIDGYKIKYNYIYRALSISLVLSLIMGLLVTSEFLLLAGIIFMTNSVLYTLGKHKYEVHLGMLSTILNVVNTSKVLKDMDLPISSKLQSNEFENPRKLYKAMNRIALIQRKKSSVTTGDIGAQMLDYLIGSTLWDFHIFDKIVILLDANRDEFMVLFNRIGEVDGSISLASFRSSIPVFCIPEFIDEKKIYFDSVYHPLVSNPIYNDVTMASNYIVTGSNASGKSTYIKAIGINMILAQSALTCLSKKAEVPRANILTSMAVQDDILTGESYYMKEINYLKRIVSGISMDELTICIVDEILRGTNREERVAASVSILRYLQKMNCLTIVASHDIIISEMLQSDYENCHFTEQMTDDDIIFDYKVRDGVSKSTNAIKLLKYVGFPSEIVVHAEEIVATL